MSDGTGREETYACAGCHGDIAVSDAIWLPETDARPDIRRSQAPYCCLECFEFYKPSKRPTYRHLVARIARLLAALSEIKHYEADYQMRIDWNLDVLRDIADSAIEDT